MLVISQKVGDKIQLGGGISVSVLEVKGGKVRLGIDAPEQVEIKRVSRVQKSPLLDSKRAVKR